MSTNQFNTHDNSSTVAQTQNLVNANSGDRVYVYRDGDELAVENAIQTAEFHLDDMVCIYQGQMDVFHQVFEGAGQILEFWWTPEGFSMVIHDGLERHQIQFIVNPDSDSTRQRAGDTL
ncbi:hypothetical protein HZS55_12930 [Halosimplex rubrum]|uniref:Uncharacterized protein n=1 Tax=Halosimplex rubrum TaxID=869889 RepID=A0A7D5TM98_9EURY|nr:hypothetical protein [Halosimplex rubrum]QLH78152.1 hypothetical protein HZS55_12930 [Halosimplex rubrum]